MTKYGMNDIFDMIYKITFHDMLRTHLRKVNKDYQFYVILVICKMKGENVWERKTRLP